MESLYHRISAADMWLEPFLWPDTTKAVFQRAAKLKIMVDRRLGA